MKHTPGPWKWTWPDGPLGMPQLEGNIPHAEMSPILVAHGCSPSCMKEYKKPCPLIPEPADRDLIEAAPDLLDACKLALVAFENNNAIDWNVLATAIAKAGGGQ